MRRMLAGILCLSALACDSKAPPAAGKITVAVVPKGTSHEFWKSIHAGANKAARELGVDVLWQGPPGEGDRKAQIEIVDNLVVRGVSGIVLAPLDDVALKAPVANAVRKKIPVVIIDSDLRSEDYASFVATDNYEGGKVAGHHLARLVGGKGGVLLLRYAQGSASTTNREQGFLDAIQEHGEIRVVSGNQYGGTDALSAQKVSENLLSTLKSADGLSVDGLFCCNESTTLGMLNALKGVPGALGKVRFVGFDSSKPLVDALRANHIHGLVLQDPVTMGYLGVKAMVEHLRGKKLEKKVPMAPHLATPQNMDEPAVKELLEPELEKWLKE